MPSYIETAEDYLIVTHAVPVERVWPYIPEGLELDTITLKSGEAAALISVTSVLHSGMKWSDQDSAVDFHQCSYKACVKRDGESGDYIFGTFVESGVPLAMRRAGIINACQAEFELLISFDPEKRLYSSFECEVVSDEGDTLLQLAPSETQAISPDAVSFITNRKISFFTMSGNSLGYARTEFAAWEPIGVTLVDAEFELWEDLEMLREDEFLSPYSVLIQPSIEIRGTSPEELK